VLQHVVDMKNANCFSPGVAGTTGDGAIAQFNSGQAAIFFLSPPTSSLLSASIPTGVFAPPPSKVGAPQSLCVNQTNFIAINNAATGDKLAAALKFIDFVARPAQSATFDKASGEVLSGYAVMKGDFSASPRLKVLAPYLNDKSPVQPVYVWPNPLVASALSKGAAGLFTGQKTIDQILTDMDNAFNQGRIS
jgi:raffinose/stachyose/melibiose transport system substrate-binding protein